MEQDPNKNTVQLTGDDAPWRTPIERLRARAKRLLDLWKEKAEPDGVAHENAEITKLIEEIQIFHIELDLQNEELQRTRTLSELTRNRFQRYYNLAPVGFVMLDDEGIICEANRLASSWLDLPPSFLNQKRVPVGAHIVAQPHCRFLSDLRYTFEDQTSRCGLVTWKSLKGNQVELRYQMWIDSTDLAAPACLCTLAPISAELACQRMLLNIATTASHGKKPGMWVVNDKGAPTDKMASSSDPIPKADAVRKKIAGMIDAESSYAAIPESGIEIVTLITQTGHESKFLISYTDPSSCS